MLILEHNNGRHDLSGKKIREMVNNFKWQGDKVKCHFWGFVLQYVFSEISLKR